MHTTSEGVKRRVSSPTQTFWIRISILIRNQIICGLGTWCIRTGPGFKALACQLRVKTDTESSSRPHQRVCNWDIWILTLSSLGLWRWRLEADLAKGQIWVSWTGQTGPKVWIRDASWASHLTSLALLPLYLYSLGFCKLRIRMVGMKWNGTSHTCGHLWTPVGLRE